VEAIAKAGYTGKVVIGMDVAASEFYTADKRYDLDFKSADAAKTNILTGSELTSLYKSFLDKYPIVSMEDPFDQVWESGCGHVDAGVGVHVPCGLTSWVVLLLPRRTTGHPTR
jgi:enolase